MYEHTVFSTRVSVATFYVRSTNRINKIGSRKKTPSLKRRRNASPTLRHSGAHLQRKFWLCDWQVPHSSATQLKFQSLLW